VSDPIGVRALERETTAIDRHRQREARTYLSNDALALLVVLSAPDREHPWWIKDAVERNKRGHGQPHEKNA
jgi:hypothetical protein